MFSNIVLFKFQFLFRFCPVFPQKWSEEKKQKVWQKKWKYFVCSFYLVWSVQGSFLTQLSKPINEYNNSKKEGQIALSSIFKFKVLVLYLYIHIYIYRYIVTIVWRILIPKWLLDKTLANSKLKRTTIINWGDFKQGGKSILNRSTYVTCNQQCTSWFVLFLTLVCSNPQSQQTQQTPQLVYVRSENGCGSICVCYPWKVASPLHKLIETPSKLNCWNPKCSLQSVQRIRS